MEHCQNTFSIPFALGAINQRIWLSELESSPNAFGVLWCGSIRWICMFCFFCQLWRSPIWAGLLHPPVNHLELDAWVVYTTHCCWFITVYLGDSTYSTDSVGYRLIQSSAKLIGRVFTITIWRRHSAAGVFIRMTGNCLLFSKQLPKSLISKQRRLVHSASGQLGYKRPNEIMYRKSTTKWLNLELLLIR